MRSTIPTHRQRQQDEDWHRSSGNREDGDGKLVGIYRRAQHLGDQRQRNAAAVSLIRDALVADQIEPGVLGL
jgi:hypothetical protein